MLISWQVDTDKSVYRETLQVDLKSQRQLSSGKLECECAASAEMNNRWCGSGVLAQVGVSV